MSASSISSVDVKNAVLATPLTKEGRVRMGKTLQNKEVSTIDFLNNCFIDADFISQTMLAEDINSGKTQYELSATQDYDHFAAHKETQKRYKYYIKRRSEKAQKEHFEKDLLGTDEKDLEHRTYSTIFLIEGPAGSGKTTYANYLLRNNFEVDLCDVETATQKSCSCFSMIYDFQNQHLNPITAVEMLLLSQIHRRLAKGHDEFEEEYRKRLKCICDIYRNQFNSEKVVIKDSSEFRKFFDCLYTYCCEEKSYDELSFVIYEQIADIIKLSDNVISSGVAYDDIHAIKFLLGILMRTYFCLSHKDNVKYILFLDNIERYIISETGKPYIAVFDMELQKILNSFYATADEMEDLLYKTYDEISKIDKETKYKTSFGVLIAVRESTLSLLKSNHSFSEYFEQHHSENVPTYVNISNWFDYYKIFMKKVEFFLGITDEHNNIFTHTFDNILNDITLSKWSLRSLLLNMFNDNFRRFFANMTEVLCNYEDVVRYYNCKWDKAKNISSPEAQHIRHLCRKLIIRIVLDYMQNVKNTTEQMGFFDCLMARCDEKAPSNDAVAKSSYARRILTYLDNMNNVKNPKAVSFPMLVKTLLHKPIIKDIHKSNVCLNDNRINDIAEIITIASQTAKIHTNGVELVTINVDSLELRKSNISKLIKERWNAYRISEKDDSSTFNIRITPAGSVFAMLCPSFEYFACRYKNNSIPLFMLKSEQERKKLIFGVEKSEDSLPEDEIGIYDKAMNCINSVLKYETRILSLNYNRRASIATTYFARPEWLYDYDGEGTGMVHVLRILCDHLGYLRDYRKFLASTDDTYDNEHYRNNDGQGVIDIAIEKYKRKYNQVIEDYRPYLEVGNIPRNFA